RNLPVTCAGVLVRPGDIIVADEDGVVVVPQERAAEVLKRAQEIGAQESGMFPCIREFKSLTKAIARFNRVQWPQPAGWSPAHGLCHAWPGGWGPPGRPADSLR